MLNKKTIAVKQEGILQSILSKIGKVYEVPLRDGRQTLSVILTYEGIKSLGIDLNTVFKGCGGREVFDEATDVKNGVLVNLDLYQQAALLKAIIRIKPELKDVLGLYNLRGSKKVYEVLNREGVPRQLKIWWMWTGERYISRENDEIADPEGIVTLANLTILKGYRFVRSIIGNANWFNELPEFHNYSGAVIFGALIK